MDTLPDVEFMGVFDRTTEYVNLKGADTPSAVRKRMNRAIRIMETAHKRARRSSSKLRWRGRVVQMKKLISFGFHHRVIAEAINKPRSFIALTLRHGKRKAEDILLERARSRIKLKVRS